MSFEKIKAAFTDSVNYVVSDISQYTVTPGRDFTRSRKMGADKLIPFLVSGGSSSTRIELLDFFGLQAGSPSASAFNQQLLFRNHMSAVASRGRSAQSRGNGQDR